MPLLINEDIDYINEDIQQQIPFLIKNLEILKLDEEGAKNLIADIVSVVKEEYVPHVVRWMVHPSDRIGWPDQKTIVKGYLNKYDAIRAAQPVALKKIGRYETFRDLITDVRKAIGSVETILIDMGIDESKITVIYRDGTYVIMQILDEETLILLSKNVAWCTKNVSNARHYLHQGPIYIVFKNDNKYSLIHPSSDQIKDIHNHTLPRDENLNAILREKLPNTEKMLFRMYPERDQNRERELLAKRDIFGIIDYVQLLRMRWPEAEELLLNPPNIDAIVRYTGITAGMHGIASWTNRVKTIFSNMVADDPRNIAVVIDLLIQLCQYGGVQRFQWIENIITQIVRMIESGQISPDIFTDEMIKKIEEYLRYLGNRGMRIDFKTELPIHRFLLAASKDIAQRLHIARVYGIKLSQEDEDEIIRYIKEKGSRTDWNFMNDVKGYINNRNEPWYEAESLVLLMSNNITEIVKYAKRMGGRWREAEEIYKDDPAFVISYAKEVLNDTWPEAEHTIFEWDDADKDDFIYEYIDLAVAKHGRWENGEEWLLSKPNLATHYASKIGGWPEAIEKFGGDKYWLFSYAIALNDDATMRYLREKAATERDVMFVGRMIELEKDEAMQTYISERLLSEIMEHGTLKELAEMILSIGSIVQFTEQVFTPELKEQILQDPDAAFTVRYLPSIFGENLSTRVLQAISGYPELLVQYALETNRRVKDHEPTIRMVGKYWETYAKRFKLQR